MAGDAKFKEASRAHTSFLAAIEKKTLIWLAHRMPAWLNSDHLTGLGLVSLLLAGLSYWYSGNDIRALHIVNLCLVVNWFGDSLDGTLARVRNRQRPRYGFYVDHVVDAVGTLSLIGGLGLSTFMSPAVAAGLIITYYLLSIEVYLATYATGKFHISSWKMGPTELRILLVIGNLYMLYKPHQIVAFGSYRWLLFDFGAAIGIAGMALMFVQKALEHTAQLYREEKLP